MTRIAAQVADDFQFRTGDSVPTRTQKLEILRQQLMTTTMAANYTALSYILSDGLQAINTPLFPNELPPMTVGQEVEVENDSRGIQHNASIVLGTRDWLPIGTGRSFRSAFRARLIAGGEEAGNLTSGFMLYSSAGIYLGDLGEVAADSNWLVADGIIDCEQTTTSTAILAAYPTAAYVRSFIFPEAKGGTYVINRPRIEDLTITDDASAALEAAEAAASAALASATAAFGHQTTAAGHATTATSQASIATGQASAAIASAVAAQSYADDADTFATASNTSAMAAATSATAAGNSASAANTSAIAAAASNTSATTQANISTTQAAVATAAGSTATTQAGLSATYAGTAADHAANATTQAGISTTQAGISTAAGATATTSSTLSASYAGQTKTTAAQLFPSDFTEDGKFWTRQYSGIPTDILGVGVTGWSFPSVAGIGKVAQRTTTLAETLADTAPWGRLTMQAGRKYRMTARMRYTSITGGGGVCVAILYGILLGPPPFYTELSNTRILAAKTVADDWFDMTFDVNADTYLGTYAALVPLLRVFLADASNSEVTHQIAYIKIEDVTESAIATSNAGIATTQAATATAAAASAQTSAVLTASLGYNSLNKNSRFADWAGGSGTIPANWVNWVSGTVNERVAGDVGGYAYQNSNTLGSSHGIYSVPAGLAAQPNGWFVVESEVTLVAGVLNGAGWYLYKTDFAATVHFAAEMDPVTGAAYGAGTVGKRYKFSKLVQATGASVDWALYLMTSWNGLDAAMPAKTLKWHSHSVRNATPAEIRDQTVLGPMETTVASHSSQISVIAAQNVAQASSITGLNATVASNTANITSNATAIATETASRVAADNVLTADVAGANASISAQGIVQADHATKLAEARLRIAVAASGGNPAILELYSATGATSFLRLGAEQILFGDNTVFDDASDVLESVTSGIVNSIAWGASFGATGANLLQWVGPTGIALADRTKANAYFYISTSAPRIGGSDFNPIVSPGPTASALFFDGATSSGTPAVLGTLNFVAKPGTLEIDGTAVLEGTTTNVILRFYVVKPTGDALLAEYTGDGPGVTTSKTINISYATGLSNPEAWKLEVRVSRAGGTGTATSDGSVILMS